VPSVTPLLGTQKSFLFAQVFEFPECLLPNRVKEFGGVTLPFALKKETLK
jgi:hypothetical protein